MIEITAKLKQVRLKITYFDLHSLSFMLNHGIMNLMLALNSVFRHFVGLAFFFSMFRIDPTFVSFHFSCWDLWN